jgi:hypothetical protein
LEVRNIYSGHQGFEFRKVVFIGESNNSIEKHAAERCTDGPVPY